MKDDLRTKVLWWARTNLILLALLLAFFVLEKSGEKVAAVWSAVGGAVLPFLVGLLAAYILHPAVVFLRRRGLSNLISVIAVFVSLGVAAGGIIAAAISGAIDESAVIAGRLPELQVFVTDAFRAAARPEAVPSWIRTIDPDGSLTRLASEKLPAALAAISKWAAGAGGAVAGRLSSGVSTALSMILAPIVAFIALVDYDEIVSAAGRVLPARARAGAQRFANRVDTDLRALLGGQILVATIVGALLIAGFSIVGTPMPVVLGVLGGLANPVPYLNLLTCAIPAILFSLIEPGGAWTALWTLLVYVAVSSVLDGMFLTPRLVGSRVRLHPLAILSSLFVFGALWGIVGMILAIPAVVVLRGIIAFSFPRQSARSS